MKKLQIEDAEVMKLALQDEIMRSEESRYDHRLHGVLLVSSGLSCGEVADLFGHSHRTVQYWVRRFERSGFAGLHDGERPGRPGSLEEQTQRLVGARSSSFSYGFGVCPKSVGWEIAEPSFV